MDPRVSPPSDVFCLPNSRRDVWMLSEAGGTADILPPQR